MKQFKLKRFFAFTAILFFVLSLLYMNDAKAQEYWTIGNTSSTSNIDVAPIDRYYDNSAVSILYLQSEMGDAKLITHLAWDKYSGVTSVTIEDVEIYMRHTTSTSLSTPYQYNTDDYQLVWSGDYPNNVSSGWIEIELDEPFVYNGEDNVQFLILKYFQSWTSSRPYWRATSTASTHRMVYTRVDGENFPTSCNSTNSSYLRPNVRFQYVPAEPDLAVANIIPPTGPYREGTYPVSVVIENRGKVKINEFKFQWRLNGVNQGSSMHYINLDPEDTYTINLGDINFTYPPNGPWNPFNIEAWVSNVNGMADGEPDENPNNDYMSINTSPILNDAGVTEFIHPAGEFGSGTQNVIVKITNFAPKPLTSVTVRWEVDGVQQANYLWSGNLAFGQSAQVTIGTYDIYVKSPLAPFYFKARTVNPNGVADQFPSNDEIEYNAAPALVPGVYTVGSSQSTFLNLSTMADYLNASGIIGNGDVTFSILPGTYNEQISLDDFPRGINNFYFTSSTGNASDVTIQYAPDGENNYILQVNSINNVHFDNLRFVPLNTNGYSTGLKINDAINAKVNNCIFQGPVNPFTGDGDYMAHASIDFHNTHDVTINNNTFNGNATQVLNRHDDGDAHNPKVSIQDNRFNDFSYAGLHYTVNGDVMQQYDINISNNEFRAGASYNPKYGIVAINGSTISNNTFNGIRNITAGTGANIYVSGSNSNGHSIIQGNSINNVNNVYGIQVSNGSADIYNNTMTLDRDSQSQLSGISLTYSSMTSHINNNTITSRGGNGIELINSQAEVHHNAVHSTGSSILFSVNSGGYIANNQFTGNGNTFGMQVMNSQEMHILYNSVYTFANTAGLMLAGSGNYYAKRNIFVNGTNNFALLASGVNTGGFESDNNIYYTNGATIGVWDSYLIEDMDLWQTLSLADENSQFMNPFFLSPSILRLTQYDPAFAVEGAIELNLTQAQRTNFEDFDYFGKPRGEENTYYVGIDQIKPVIIIDMDPRSITACEGTTGNSIEINAIVSLGAKATYQWYRDGAMIPGATDPVLDLDQFSSSNGIEYAQNGLYRVYITAEGGATPVWSKDAAVYVIGETEVIQHPKDAYVNIGQTAVFTVKAHAKFLPPDSQLDYQWYKYEIDRERTIALENNARYAGVNTDILSIKVQSEEQFTTDLSYYFVEVRGECGTVRSANASLLRNDSYGVEILEGPLSQEECLNSEAMFTVNAEATGSSMNLTYQWFKNSDLLEDDGRINGSKTNTLTINNLNPDDAGAYRVRVREIEGGTFKDSEYALLTVSTTPVIVSGLVDMVVPENSDVTLIVEASGSSEFEYDWYHDDVMIQTGPSAFYDLLRFDQAKAGIYRVVIKNDCGETETSAFIELEDGGVSVKDVILIESIVPNPATTEIKIQFETLEIGNTIVKLRDLTGREYLSQNINTNEGINNVKLDVNELANGTYFIELRIGNNSKVVPVVIMK